MRREPWRNCRRPTQLKPDQTDLAMAYFQALAANKQIDEAEKLALSVIDKHPTFAPMYDALYLYYMNAQEADPGRRHLEAKGGEQSAAVQLPGATGGILSVHAAARRIR